MTRFKLNAGRPTPYLRSGPPASIVHEEAAKVKKPDYWAPNVEPDTLLACGDWIPWPVVQLIGSGSQSQGRQVWCDLHGWQHVTAKEIARAKKAGKEASQCITSQSSLTDLPPF